MKLRSSRRIVADVLVTLVRREWRYRFSRGRLATLWLLLEPLVQTILIGWLYSAFGRTSIGGQDAPLFLGIGIFAFLMFRNLCIRPSDAITAGSGLMSYRQVHVLDLVVAKWISEALAYLALLALGLLYLQLFEPSFDLRIALFLYCLVIILAGSLGIACLLSYLRRRIPSSTAFIRPVSYALYLFSGVLHPVWELNERLANWLAYNPLVSLLEKTRASLLHGYDPSIPDYPFILLMLATLPVIVGFELVLRRADRLRTR